MRNSSLFVAFVAFFCSLAAYAADPCKGPRGDGTFTTQELLNVVTVKTETTGSEKVYRAVWPCPSDTVFTLVVMQTDFSGLHLSTHESVYSWDRRTLGSVVRLSINLNDLSKKTVHEGKEILVRLGYSAHLRHNDGADVSLASAYRMAKKDFTVLHQAFRKNNKDAVLRLAVRLDRFHGDEAFCVRPGKTALFNTLHFGVEHAELNGNVLW